MDTWTLLKKELGYYGIKLINNKKCQIEYDGVDKVFGVIRTIRILNKHVETQKKLLLSLWDDVVDSLQEQAFSSELIDDNMTSLFVFSLKDLTKYLLCFDDLDKSKYYATISSALSRDIKTFNKSQVYSIPEYKISIDWITRNISRLLYISNLLSLASMGEKKVSQYELKTAGGIAGPWSRLELPMEERVFPFGFGLRAREKGKQKQRRYTKGLENYNNDGRVGEGHYWRELRNEPFSWFDRGFEDPYPSRKQLSGRG
jgi:hypothetical protein